MNEYTIDGIVSASLLRIIQILVREEVHFEATFHGLEWSLDYDDISESAIAEIDQINREYRGKISVYTRD